MSLDEFLSKLREVAKVRKFGIYVYGTIRTTGPASQCDCPLQAVAAPIWAQPLEPVMAEIIKAADRLPGHDPALRARLLEACGLTEPVDNAKG